VWLSNRPAKGGDAGAMLATIIERAAQLKADRASPARRTAAHREEPKPRQITKTTKARTTARKKATKRPSSR
jgi:hypothetical protein